MSEESQILGCGHRNDVAHLITIVAAGIFKSMNESGASSAGVADEIQASIQLILEKTGLGNPEIDGERIFNQVRAERITHLFKKLGGELRGSASANV